MENNYGIQDYLKNIEDSLKSEISKNYPLYGKPKKKILILDDNPKNLGIFWDFFSRDKSDVYTATNLNQAKEIVQNIKPDKILSDLDLAGNLLHPSQKFAGIEFCLFARKISPNSEIILHSTLFNGKLREKITYHLEKILNYHTGKKARKIIVQPKSVLLSDSYMH
jgi:CheY-like chemotaxis protein